jgi:ABC-2 type transport system ATP-binding protein
MTISTASVEVIDLKKRFRVPKGWFGQREVAALNGVSFKVRAGGSLGIIGSNGSGKSTLLKILSTLILPTSGKAWIGGFPISSIAQIKTFVGYVPGNLRRFSPRLSGRQNLEFFAVLQKLPPTLIPPRLNELLDIVGLHEMDGQPVWTYSTGQQQRLSIAHALLHNPSICLLDEPTKGLDLWGARTLRKWIRKELVERQKKTLLIASNQTEDILELCDEAIYLKQGHMMWQRPVSEGPEKIFFSEAPENA